MPASLNDKMSELIRYLRTSRCLLILDNAESILQSCDRQGRYLEKYEGYEKLLRVLGNTAHHSCLILSSREQPKGLAAMEGDTLPVRCFRLTGLPEAAGKEIFQAKGQFSGMDRAWQAIVQYYGGNPLALKIVASEVKALFDGNLCKFLRFLTQHPFIFDDIRDLLAQQFDRLPSFEQSLMYWLAIKREPIALQALQASVPTPISASELLKALAVLQNRSLVERQHDRFTQQPVVMEFVTVAFVEHICEEITTGHIDLFKQYVLVEAQTKDCIQIAQMHFILQAVVDRLIVQLGSPRKLEDCIQRILMQLKSRSKSLQHSAEEAKHICSNSMALLHHIQADLATYDCSAIPCKTDIAKPIHQSRETMEDPPIPFG